MTSSSQTYDDDPSGDLLVNLALGLDPGPGGSEAESLDEHEREELEEFELAAAALYLGFRTSGAASEPSLVADERARALQRFHELAARPPQAPLRRHQLEPRSRSAAASPRPVKSAELLPWLVAAAALVVFGVSYWNTKRELDAVRDQVAVAEVPASQRVDELAAAAGTRELAWTALEDEFLGGQDVTGSVLWNAELGEGVMRFEGLPANDPQREQYQLWIFDRRLPDATPVDGGVFDIQPGAENAIVSIDPKLGISDAWRFAVTLEPPGGVVVSDREHLLLLADV